MSSPLHCLSDRTYAFVDVETTGMSPSQGEIIEIGIVRVEKGVVVEQFDTLIAPHRSISTLIEGITGISNTMLHGQPRFEDVADKIYELTHNALFVAHNARFDHSFLKNEFKRIGVAWNAQTLCSVKVSRILYPNEKSHRLESIIKRHNINVSARHRALPDAQAILAFFKKAEMEFGQEKIRSALKLALQEFTLPSQLDPREVTTLPHAPGVYFFYDERDTLLYIGKSVDIKARVRSHFSGSHASAKELKLSSLVSRIDHETTSGELSALLRESSLIKELAPVYNRLLRKRSALACVRTKESPSGYLTATTTYEESNSLENIASIQGIFRTLQNAKAVLKKKRDEHTLCLKLLGLEKSAGACFHFQLGKCNGACVGKETSREYNQRFLKAFETIKIRSWPFRGAITVPEDQDAIEGSAFVIDDWRIIKKIDYTQEGYSEISFDQPFDYDTYRILSKHLMAHYPRRSLQNEEHSIT